MSKVDKMSAKGGKTLLGVVIIGAAIVLSGCAKPGAVNQDTAQNQNQNQTQQNESSKGSVITSIKEAMGLGKKMECVYTTQINGKEIKAVMQTDGKNFKSSSEIDGRKMYSVMKDEVSYTWGEGIPTASKLSLSCIKDLPKPEGQESNYPVEDMQNPEKAFDGATNVVCNPVTAVDISVPSNIQFQDMCEMMKGMMNMTKNMKIPSGANVPNIPNMPNIPGR